MTIDEAIEKEKQRSIEATKLALFLNASKDEVNEWVERSKKHNQIVDWLEELKWYRQGMEDIPSESGVLPKDVYMAGYLKGIDDLLEKIESKYNELDSIDLPDVELMAYQLKEGVENGD